ncbi:MAG: hypothetical protein JRH11_01065 [Deltaproteobacteria bacterium]|nr:hypothetical protein [Deltaproteobacteria bacterium]
MDRRHTYGRSALWLLVICVLGGSSGCNDGPSAVDSAIFDGALDAPDTNLGSQDTGMDGTTDVGARADSGASCEGTLVAEVHGTIETESGGPIAGARPQACIRRSPGRALTCLEPPTADAAGVYIIEVPDEFQCWASAALRMLLPEGGYATTYCDLDPSPTVDGVLTLADAHVLYATPPAITRPPIGDATAMRTVVFDDGLEMDIVPDRLGFGVDYDALSGRRVPVGSDAPCFAAGAGLAGLYGFGEEGSADGGGVPVRIPNTTSIPAGTRVELLLVGGLATELADGTPVEEADLVAYGTGTVSADGTFVESDPGSELPYFTWLGYRVAP